MRNVRRVTRAVVPIATAALMLASVAPAALARSSSSRRPTSRVRARRHHSSTGAPASSSVGQSNRFSPEVIHTGRPPTGYEVTFRYWDPTATSVQIKGEWYFSSPGQTTTTSSQGLLPSQWVPGDFPIAHPNEPAANWPVTTMTKSRRSGVWSYTTPLPSGVFNYGFFVNCSSSTQAGCTEISDPSNAPWNVRHGVTAGSTEPTSQVYVPSDPRFHTVNYWWEAPSRVHGSLVDVTYNSPLSQSPVGKNYLAIYTPPGYDPNRSTPYPTLYLSHGGGGNEVDWSTQGAAGNILDNLIATGEIQPMVVVMTNFNGFGGGCGTSSWETDYDQNLVSAVIPYVQSNYDVSSAPSQRAFAGLSCGGDLTGTLLVNYTSDFGYFGVMSPGPNTIPTLSGAQQATIKQVAVLVGGGWQDPIHANALTDLANVQEAGGEVFPDFINGGHEWTVWRVLLKDFLTRVAFFPNVG
jgi:enterochelin esterase-like enzyme